MVDHAVFEYVNGELEQFSAKMTEEAAFKFLKSMRASFSARRFVLLKFIDL